MLIKARVKENNLYGRWGAGEIVLVDPNELKRVPHCLEAVKAKDQPAIEPPPLPPIPSEPEQPTSDPIIPDPPADLPLATDKPKGSKSRR